MRTAAVVIAAVTLAACGSAKLTSPTDPKSGANVIWSGAVAGTSSTSTVASGWVSSTNQGAVTISVPPGTGGFPSVTIGLGFLGEPTAGSFKNTDAGAKAGIIVQTDLLKVYGAFAGQSSTASQGSYTLTLTSVSTAAATTDGKVYTVHGTLDASLPAVQGTNAQGTVILHATF